MYNYGYVMLDFKGAEISPDGDGATLPGLHAEFARAYATHKPVVAYNYSFMYDRNPSHYSPVPITISKDRDYYQFAMSFYFGTVSAADVLGVFDPHAE